MNALSNRAAGRLASLLAGLAVLLASGGTSHAAPTTLTQTGRLFDGNGQPVNDTLSVTVSLWTADTGGDLYWSETFDNVAVVDGYFSMLLGADLDNELVLDTTQYYVGVKVGTDAEMTPRAPLATGLPGRDGHNTLVAMTSESPGANCSAGGKKLSVGVDDGLGQGSVADNGVLEPNEIDTTGYACNGTDGASASLTSGYIFVGNGSNVATAVALSGDATLSNSGVLTIASDAVTSAKIANGEIVDADLSASAGIALSKLAAGAATGVTMIYNGTSWTSLAGTLGAIMYRDGTTWAALAGNTTTTKQFLTQTGTGAASAAPVWGAVTAADAGAKASGATELVATGGTGVTSYTAGDILYYASGTALSKLPVGTTGQVLTADPGNSPKVKWAAAAGGAAYPPGYLDGFLTKNDTYQGNITIEAGRARDAGDTTNLTWAGGTITIGATAATIGAGGLDAAWSGGDAYKIYHAYVIYNPSTLAYAGIASLSPTAPSLPSGYTKYVRIGGVSLARIASQFFLARFQSFGRGKSRRFFTDFNNNILWSASGVAGSSTYDISANLAGLVPTTASSYTYWWFSDRGSNVHTGLEFYVDVPWSLTDHKILDCRATGSTDYTATCSGEVPVLASTHALKVTFVGAGTYEVTMRLNFYTDEL